MNTTLLQHAKQLIDEVRMRSVPWAAPRPPSSLAAEWGGVSYYNPT
jgi:hypothetical protein